MRATIDSAGPSGEERLDALGGRRTWLFRSALSFPPIVAVTALAFVAAGNTLWSGAPWRSVRSAVLWCAFMLILMARAWLARTKNRVLPPSLSERAPTDGWTGSLPAVAFIGLALLAVIVLGELFPGEGRASRNARLLVLAPACVIVLADWRRVRRELLTSNLRTGAEGRGRGAESAEWDGLRAEIATENLLFQCTWIAACALSFLAIANALWGDHEVWLTARPFAYSVVLIYFASLWRSHGASGELLSRLRHAAGDEYRRARALRRRSAEETILREHFLSRNWAIDDDAARDRTPSTGLILDALALRDGMRVADVGAGGGYFALEMAERVGPVGEVVATDVAVEFVSRLRERVRRRELTNVQVNLVDRQFPLHGVESLDRVLLANLYLFSPAREAQGRAWLEHLAQSLRPGGKLVLYSDFVHDAGWVASPEWPPLAAPEADPQVLLEWSASWFDLEADVPLPPPCHPLAPNERPGYLLVLRRRRKSGFLSRLGD